MDAGEEGVRREQKRDLGQSSGLREGQGRPEEAEALEGGPRGQGRRAPATAAAAGAASGAGPGSGSGSSTYPDTRGGGRTLAGGRG